MLNYHWYSGDPTPIAYRLKDSLEAALYDINADVSTPQGYQQIEGFFDDNIKINKLSHRAIKRWNLPLIHSWYRYGQIVPYDELQPDQLSPEPLSTPVGSSSRPPSPSGAGEIPEKEHLRDWFVELSNPSLKEILEMNLFDFLRWDYNRFAPDKYKNLYLTNLNILEVLEEIRIDDDLPNNALDYRERLQEATLDIKYYLSDMNIFSREVKTVVESGLRTIQDALIKISDINDPTGNQIRTVKNSRKYYHKKAWSWPAHLIALDRAKGPKEYVKNFEEGFGNNLHEIQNTYPGYLEEFQTDILESNLQPKGTHYRSLQSSEAEVASAFGDAVVTE